MRRCRTTLLGAGMLALAVSACNDPAGPDPGGPSGASRARNGRVLLGLDRELAELARAVPGFGGVSRRPDGSAILYLTDPSRSAAAKQAIAARSRLLGGIDASRIEVRAARFDYVRLTDWRARLRAELDVPGLVFLDIDESTNHLRIGVVQGTSHGMVESAVTRLEVPANAVSIEDASPVRFSTTLREHVRPTHGGLQITFRAGPAFPPGSFFLCTLGFNARVARSSDTYLVTNSHCSGDAGGNQHTEIFQPVPAPENLIALEHADPDYFSDGCYPNFRCRFSDASLARYVPGVEATVGTIARTALRGLTSGSLVIDDRQPTFTITDRQPFSVVGETLDKVGRTTGWTVGSAVFTCVDVLIADAGVALLCQDGFLTGVGGGDSGSPVFESRAPFTNDVSLYGLLCCSGGTTFGPVAFFSPLENIEEELGPLMVTAP